MHCKNEYFSDPVCRYLLILSLKISFWSIFQRLNIWSNSASWVILRTSEFVSLPSSYILASLLLTHGFYKSNSSAIKPTNVPQHQKTTSKSLEKRAKQQNVSLNDNTWRMRKKRDVTEEKSVRSCQVSGQMLREIHAQHQQHLEQFRGIHIKRHTHTLTIYYYLWSL